MNELITKIMNDSKQFLFYSRSPEGYQVTTRSPEGRFWINNIISILKSFQSGEFQQSDPDNGFEAGILFERQGHNHNLQSMINKIHKMDMLYICGEKTLKKNK